MIPVKKRRREERIMKCSDSIELISLYLDKELDKESQLLLFKHTGECENCKRELEEMKSLMNKLDQIPLIELPENFHNELMVKIANTKKATLPITKNNKKTHYRKKYIGVAAAFLLLLVVGGNAGNFINKSSYDNYSAQSAAEEQEEHGFPKIPETSPQSLGGTGAMPQENELTEMADLPASKKVASVDTSSNLNNTTGSLEGSEGTTVDERKQIKTLNIDMEVKNFDSAINLMKDNIKNFGGYVENYNSSVYNVDKSLKNALKEGNITFKIPRENYEDSKTMLSDIGMITNEYEQTEDITGQYVDTAGRLKMKRLEEERLLDILSKSQTVEDLIKVEERLGIIRTEIENDASLIKNWDKLIRFSTINVSIRESGDSKLTTVAPDFMEKIKNTFINSLNSMVGFFQNLVLTIVRFAVPILIVVIICIIIIIFIKRNKK